MENPGEISHIGWKSVWCLKGINLTNELDMHFMIKYYMYPYFM